MASLWEYLTQPVDGGYKPNTSYADMTLRNATIVPRFIARGGKSVYDSFKHGIQPPRLGEDPYLRRERDVKDALNVTGGVMTGGMPFAPKGASTLTAGIKMPDALKDLSSEEQLVLLQDLWNAGGFKTPPKMPLEKFLEKGNIDDYTWVMGDGGIKGITKEPGPRGDIVSVGYRGLDDLLESFFRKPAKSNVADPFDSERQLLVNGRFNPAADPYSDYNLAMRPQNRDYLPLSSKPYEAVYQRIMQDLRDSHGLSRGQQDLDVFSKWNAIKDKATSQHPKPLIQLLEQFKSPLKRNALTLRNDGAYTPHTTNPDHWNSATLVGQPGSAYVKRPPSKLKELIQAIEDGELIDYREAMPNFYAKPGQDSYWNGIANVWDPMEYNLTPYFHTEPSGSKPVISLLRKGSETIPMTDRNAKVVYPSNRPEILQQQKQIAEQLPLTEYLQYILKHNKAPF